MGDDSDGALKRAANAKSVIGRPFAVGNPGGPGRPKMDPEVKAILAAATPDAARKLVEALSATRSISVGMGPTARVEEVPDMDLQVKAANHILDRLFGKPAQAITGEDGGPVQVTTGLYEMFRGIAERREGK